MNAASRFIDAKVARQGALFFLSFTTLVLSTSGAYAANSGKASNEVSFLVALLTLVLVGRLLGAWGSRRSWGSCWPVSFWGLRRSEGRWQLSWHRESNWRNPLAKTLGVLVPITATDVSRRAAEIAFSLGKGATVTALYVEQKSWAKSGNGRSSRRQARTILNDIAEMASRYNVKIETRKVSGVRPTNAILNEAKAGAHDLIVMGVGRRPGERLYFGDTPTAVLAKSPCSLLFLSP